MPYRGVLFLISYSLFLIFTVLFLSLEVVRYTNTYHWALIAYVIQYSNRLHRLYLGAVSCTTYDVRTMTNSSNDAFLKTYPIIKRHLTVLDAFNVPKYHPHLGTTLPGDSGRVFPTEGGWAL